MNLNLPTVLTYAAVVPLYGLQAAGWALIAGAAVLANLVASPVEEVPSVVPTDKERAVA